MSMRTLLLDKGVNLTRDDGSTVYYPAGPNAMPAEDADHWFIQHAVAKQPEPVLGDMLYAKALRARADAKIAEAQKADEMAVEAEDAYEAKLAEGRAKAAPLKPPTGPIQPPAPTMTNEGLAPNAGLLGDIDPAKAKPGTDPADLGQEKGPDEPPADDPPADETPSADGKPTPRRRPIVAP